MIALTADIPEKAREWRNDPRIYRWCRQNTLISETEHHDWLYKIDHDPTIKMFGINKRSINSENLLTPIGVCGFTSIDYRNQSAEFSLYIAPEYQRKGYGKKALELLIEHGFKEFNFHRIWGEVLDGNPAMQMFKELKFSIEGTQVHKYHKDGHWQNATMIALAKCYD